MSTISSSNSSTSRSDAFRRGAVLTMAAYGAANLLHQVLCTVAEHATKQSVTRKEV